jgi:PIN domain nuclease of toxin-antitoxin system
VKLLLDTQCWLWWFSQPERLNEAVIDSITDETNALWFSVASVWEMGIKVAIGKLPLPEPIDSYIASRMVQEHNLWKLQPFTLCERPRCPCITEIPLTEC